MMLFEIKNIQYLVGYKYMRIYKMKDVVVNDRGGYHEFKEEYELGDGFLKTVEVKENEEPLTLDERYPKNSDKFVYGWISPEGDTFITDIEGHNKCSYYLCKEYGYNEYNCERELEIKGWVKVTGIHEHNGITRTVLLSNKPLFLTKKQADKLFDLNLEKSRFVDFFY